MKIQFGEKSEVSWDVLEKTVKGGELQTKQHLQSPYLRAKESFWRWCYGRSWLTLTLIVSVVILTQLWLYLYVFPACDTKPLTHLMFTDDLGNVRHVRFSWRNCGSKTDPVQLKVLQVKPDPLMIDGNITVTMDSYVGLDLDSPITAQVTVKRKTFWWWLKIPCVTNLGSCSYEDICKLTPFLPPAPCPDPFPRFGLPCRCPVAKGRYKVNNGVFDIPGILNLLPKWLVSGDYYVQATAQKNGRSLGCYSVYASVTY